MVKVIIAIFGFCLAAQSQTMTPGAIHLTSISQMPELWSLGFYGHYNAEPYSDIEWPALTHIIDFIYTNDLSGNIGTVKTFDANLITTAHANGVKVLFGLRPDGDHQDRINTITTNGNLATLTSNIMTIVNAQGYDGIDLDYEPDVDNAIALSNVLTSFRASLGTNLLTFDWNRSTPLSTGLVAIVDRMNVMTYDATCIFHTWFVNPLYGFPLTNFNYSANAFWPWVYASADGGYVHWYYHRLLDVTGINPRKINVAIAFYGYQHGGGVPIAHGPWEAVGSPPDTRLVGLSYTSISSNYNLNAIATYDNLARSAWFPISTGWIEYEDERSVRDKCVYAINRGVGGVFIFPVEFDYDALKTPKHPLLHTIRKTLCRP